MRKSVAFFPSLPSYSGNPYWKLLAMRLGDLGYEVIDDNPDTISLRWLSRNRNRTPILHFHFIQQAYAYEKDYARLRWVIRFARNLLAARVFGYRIIWTMHNSQPSFPLRPSWIDELAHLIIANLAHSVIVHCQAAKNLLEEKYKRSQNVIIAYHPHYIGIYPDNNTTKSAARQRFGLTNDNRNILLYFGGMRPNKGIESLIQAFHSLNRKDTYLIIAGKSQEHRYTNYLKALSKENPNILFFDRWISNSEVQFFFRASDVVVLPFSRVLSSASVILAMSFGRAVIAPKKGCLQEVIPVGTGWLYDDNDQGNLVETIQLALDDDFDMIGKQAYKFVQNFSWNSFVENVVLAYRQYD